MLEGENRLTVRQIPEQGKKYFRRNPARDSPHPPQCHLLFLLLLLLLSLLLASVSINCPGKPMARLVKAITPTTTSRSVGEYTAGANGSESVFPNRSSVSGLRTFIFPEQGLFGRKKFTPGNLVITSVMHAHVSVVKHVSLFFRWPLKSKIIKLHVAHFFSVFFTS